MHATRDGVLASEWRRDGKTGDEVSVQDSAMAIVALNEYDQRLAARESEGHPEFRAQARKMAKAQADFPGTPLDRRRCRAVSPARRR